MTEIKKGACTVCPRQDVSVTATGGLRVHAANGKKTSPDNPACPGSGQEPKGAQAGPVHFLCRVPAGPTGCGHEVQLTANHRARSHLNRRGNPCPGGSDWPIAVLGSDRLDTAVWTEDEWKAALPRNGEILPAARPEDLKIEEETDFDPRPVQDVPLSFSQGPDGSLREMIPGGLPDVFKGEERNTTIRPTDRAEYLERAARIHTQIQGRCKHDWESADVASTSGMDELVNVCKHCGLVEEEETSPLARLSDLDEGVLFVRHTAKAPLDKLVYRVQAVTDFCVQVTVVSMGSWSGRTGELTNLTEEITCTDLNGQPRPRSTPSAPRTAPSPSRAPGSTPTMKATAPPATSTTSKRATSSGRTGTAGTSPRTAPVPDAFSTPKEAVRESDKYDSYGRYKMLHPVTGKKVNWTRATTFCKSIQDTYALSMWSQRMVLKGSSLRPDLTAAAGTLEVKADKDRMNGLVDEAKKAAGDKIAANKGTAVHAYTEDLDKELAGMPVEPKTVPDEFVPTVQAYREILSGFGLEPVPGLIEFSTGVIQYDVGGTADRVYRVTRDITVKLNGRPVTLYAGEYVIGDVKTGADLSYGWQEIAIQLALYAQGLNTSGVWDWGTRIWSRPEDGSGHQIQVRTDVGIVPHLPVDRSTTRAPLATLYAVDLTAGWAAAVLCGQVRSWRKERTLATPLEIADVADEQGLSDNQFAERVTRNENPSAPVSRPVPASRPVTLRDEAQAVTSRAEASAVYQKAVAARMPKKEVGELVQIMSDKLKSFTEQGA